MVYRDNLMLEARSLADWTPKYHKQLNIGHFSTQNSNGKSVWKFKKKFILGLFFVQFLDLLGLVFRFHSKTTFFISRKKSVVLSIEYKWALFQVVSERNNHKQSCIC